MTCVDVFERCRFWGRNRTNKLFSQLRIYSILNRLIDIIANVLLPIYFKITQNNPNCSLYDNKREGRKVIVSLTSFPKRLPTLWLVIETILRQTVKPDEIVLYLTASQVPDLNKLPGKLQKQQKRGLRIELVPDEIRSHTKYFYAFQQYPNDIVITVDDDLFYRSDLVEKLLQNHFQYPTAIIANWVKEILPNKFCYNEWPDGDTSKLSKNMCLLGVNGVLYPPHCLYKDVFQVELIQRLCLTADDVWLTCMALMNNTAIYFTAYDYRHLPVMIHNNETLISINYERNQRCVDNINTYYQSTIGLQPFKDIPVQNYDNNQFVNNGK